MSDLSKRFLPFGELAPDGVEFDQPELEIAKNLTPSYGAYRAVEERQQLAELSSSLPLRGGYAHLRSTPGPNIKMFLSDGVLMTGNFYTKDFVLLDDADVDNYDAASTHGPDADDTTYVRSRGIKIAPGVDELRYIFEAPPRTPTTGTLGDIVLRVRLRFDGSDSHKDHRIDWTLYDADTPQTIATGTMQPASDAEGFIEFEHELSTAEQALIADWAQVEFRFIPEATSNLSTTFYEVPDQDEDTGGWADETGSKADLFEHIDDVKQAPPPNPDLGIYVESPQIPAGSGSTAIWRWEALGEAVDPETSGPTFWANATANKENVSLKMQVIQPDTGEPTLSATAESITSYAGSRWEILWEKTIDNISTDQSTPTPSVLTEAIADGYAWAQTHDVSRSTYVSFTFTYGGDGGTTTDGMVYLVPDEEISKFGGITGAYTDVDNCVGGDEDLAVDGAYYQVNGGAGFKRFLLSLEPGASRTRVGDHKIHVRARSTVGGDVLNTRFGHDDHGSLENKNHTLTTSFAWYVMGIRTGRVALIPNYDGLYCQFDSTPVGNIQISELYFSYPGDSAKGRLYNTYAQTYPDKHLEMSMVLIDAKDPKNFNVSDLNDIYVGTNDNLYEVSAGSFEDVTRVSSDYGQSSLDDIAKLWNFTSWGDDVIAVNYADLPQRRVSGATNFTDLVTSTEKPRARFCAVVGAQLILADINPTSYADGRPYSLWSSFLLDPTNFEPADLDNLSAIFQLVAKAGGITGLVGGEYGIVFKRNSIWRMTFAGFPVAFQFSLIAEGVGCAYPNSIVSAGADVYFWGPGGVFVLRGGFQLERISAQRIEKFLFDTAYESDGIYNSYGPDSRENEALVWGAYDTHSGLIWWLYRSKNETEFKLDKAVCYSTTEGRFTTISSDSMDWTLLLGSQNTATNDPVLNRGIMGFKYTDTETRYEKLIGDQTQPAQLKTKVITPTSWGMEIGQECEIHKIRPMYTAQFQSDLGLSGTGEPNFGITVDSAQDPAMRINPDSRVVDRVREDRDGWLTVGRPISGEFFQFTVDIPTLYRTQMKEFLGLQMVIRPAGDF